MAVAADSTAGPPVPPKKESDLPPLPNNTVPVMGPARDDEFSRAQDRPHDSVKIVEAHEEDHPTESHALADADHDVKGAAQMDHGETEVKDLGWNEKADDVPVPLVGGLPNEDLWMLIRRFNKVSFSLAIFDLNLIPSAANVLCEIPRRTPSRWPRSQHCR